MAHRIVFMDPRRRAPDGTSYSLADGAHGVADGARRVTYRATDIPEAEPRIFDRRATDPRGVADLPGVSPAYSLRIV
jgi:hypothetical protein